MIIKTIRFRDIKIPNSFLLHQPAQSKINKAKDFLLQNKYLDRLLIINSNNYLIDGYAAYCALYDLGYDDNIQVALQNKRTPATSDSIDETLKITAPTTYVFGKHYSDDIERVWRITPSTLERLGTIKIGDKLLVQTSRGINPITVTKVQMLFASPRVGRIKKVVNRLIESGD